jgi:hypothetical protein
MPELPTQVWDLVKDNVAFQWLVLVAAILLLTTNTAAKLKGPVGAAARWYRTLGERRDEREAAERRTARQRILSEARESRAYVEHVEVELRAQIESLYANQEALNRLIREHLGWDYDRVQQLIGMGIRPGDIPTPPPLRVPWRPGEAPSEQPRGVPPTVPTLDAEQVRQRRGRHTQNMERPQVNGASA